MAEYNWSGVNAADSGLPDGDRVQTGIVEWAAQVYTPKAPAKKAAPATPGPDGYLRKTPVQEIRIPGDYIKRMARRAVAIMIGVLIAAAAAYFILTHFVRL